VRKSCLLVLCLLLLHTAQARAQLSSCTQADTLLARDTVGIKPAVLLRATVRAEFLRFEQQPSQRLDLLGCAARDRFIVTTRTNLPTPIQPGVTYSNAVISIEIRSYARCDVAAGFPAAFCSATDSGSIKRSKQ
jgi:hypothetical protein